MRLPPRSTLFPYTTLFRSLGFRKLNVFFEVGTVVEKGSGFDAAGWIDQGIHAGAKGVENPPDQHGKGLHFAMPLHDGDDQRASHLPANSKRLNCRSSSTASSVAGSAAIWFWRSSSPGVKSLSRSICRPAESIGPIRVVPST